MSSELIPLAVSLLYGIPSFVLYVFILFQLVRLKYRKRFSNPFYGLCFAIGVVDCFGYIIYYAFFTLPMYSIASSIFSSSFFAPSALTSGIYFSLFFFGYLQLFGNCFLTMNRFTAIASMAFTRCFSSSVVSVAETSMGYLILTQTSDVYFFGLHLSLRVEALDFDFITVSERLTSIPVHYLMIALHTEIVYLLIGIPTLIFYAAIMLTLLKKSNKEVFGFAFYRIFAVICVLDCLMYIMNTITFRLPMCPQLSFLYVHIKPSAFTTALYFGLFFFSSAQLFTGSLICLNRFSAVAFPAKHKTFWRKHYHHCIGVTLFLGFACSWQTLLSNAQFMKHSIDGTNDFFFTFMFDDMSILFVGKAMQFNSILVAALNIFISVFQLGMNSATIGLLIHQRKSTNTSANRPKPELNLLFLSIAMFLVVLTNGLYQVVVTVLLYMESDYIVPFLDYYLLVADFNNLAPPYLLFIVSGTARKTFFESMRFKKPHEASTVQLFVSRDK
ncbi:hypothetical protein QR680_007927 [Steinernema hermaphroditum]|uniref:Serpentine receptor class gamma n=1 Tax=Steinernema hermaphroditum TaxID=289476 RepID=A0AA39M6X3_9BILA|nr:hypothetical protein QR680_007927 [Steinernema hermaphroditum]